MIKLEVDLSKQQLHVINNDSILKSYSISTAQNGAGEEYGSLQTPRGKHVVRAKIGENCPVNTIFTKRRPTGEFFIPEMMEKFPERDWILTRILWLCGKEPGKNRFGNVDTMKRKIYIHGSPDIVKMGQTGSRGCVRMRNNDIIELFDVVSTGTPVWINEHGR